MKLTYWLSMVWNRIVSQRGRKRLTRGSRRRAASRWAAVELEQRLVFTTFIPTTFSDLPNFTLNTIDAPSFVVTTNSDVVDNTDGLTSLREALAFAASNPGADTITFGDGSAIGGGTNFTDVTGDMITLGGTQLTVDSNVMLDGPGAALLSISGNNASRVFQVSTGVTAEIRDVTITGGNASIGGGIYSIGNLTISHSTISGNTVGGDGGGIFSGNGTLTVSHSTISGNTADDDGGGIFTSSTLTVSYSTISGNTADDAGGGIFTSSTLTASHSTISENSAGGDGGGIFNSNGTLTVSHSTISGNTANDDGGGIFNADDSTTIVNSTLVNNRADADGNSTGTGGGTWTANDGVTFTTLHNTIVAGNFVGTGTTADDMANKPLEAASRNNLIGSASSAGGLTNGTNGNIVGALLADIFATGALANNGGPTQTIALKAGGPAVNAGDNASVPADTLDLDGDLNTTEPVPFDQRGTGFARILGTSVDIGAFELPNAAPTAVAATPNPGSIVENTSTATRIKVADITITDDGQGTNELSLSGPDVAFFEIDGTELFLKAGTVLDFETKNSYLVTFAVDDTSVGTTPDATNSFTLNVTNLDETVLNVNQYGGLLIVDATNNLNSNLQISQATGDTVIAGLLGTQVSFNGAAPVNSVTLTPAQLSTITGIIFNMKGGGDSVDLVDTNVAGLVLFNGHLPYFSGPDQDTFSIRSETKNVTIGGPVIAYMSQGDGTFNATVANGHTLQFNGAAYIYGGFIDDGATTVNIQADDDGSVLNFQSLLYTDLRDGDDAVSINAVRSQVNLRGGLFALQGAGHDTLALQTTLNGSITVDSFASIYGDGGNNNIDFGGRTTINGPLTVLGGNGDDALTFKRGSGFSIAPVLNGPATISLGDGDNSALANFGTAFSGLLYLGGSGNDSFTINRASTDSFTALLGEGTNSINADRLDVTGPMLVTGGLGTDEVVLSRSQVNGSLTALMGNGANQKLELNTSSVSGATFGILTGSNNSVSFQSGHGSGSSLNSVTLITGPGATVNYGDATGAPLTITGHTSIFGTTPNTILNIFTGTPNTFTRTLLNVTEVLI